MQFSDLTHELWGCGACGSRCFVALRRDHLPEKPFQNVACLHHKDVTAVWERLLGVLVGELETPVDRHMRRNRTKSTT